jgi:hypothetical protein
VCAQLLPRSTVLIARAEVHHVVGRLSYEVRVSLLARLPLADLQSTARPTERTPKAIDGFDSFTSATYAGPHMDSFVAASAANVGTKPHQYVGISAYCYANALFMALSSAGFDTNLLGDAGFLECLTTQPFGCLLVRTGDHWLPLFSSAYIDPDRGVTHALAALGWTCLDERGGDTASAATRLCRAVRHGPALAGPLDMSLLTHNPRYAGAIGADHFVLVLKVADTPDQHVQFHDPGGFPFATLPLEQFLLAWRAERVGYPDAPYVLRSAFVCVEPRTRAEAIERALPGIRRSLTADPGGPERYGGLQALELTVDLLRQSVPPRLAGHLTSFALPLAARRRSDAAAFLHEAGHLRASAIVAQQAELFGAAQYPAAQGRWGEAGVALREIITLERDLIASV